MYSPEDFDDLRENALLLVDEYVRLNIGHYIQPNFGELLEKYVSDILASTLKYVYDTEALAAILKPIVTHSIAFFYKHIAPPRSNGDTFIRRKPNVSKMREKITYLQTIPQPDQRTKEWYEFRYKHLTASNIWKVFISDSTRNQLIVEKCQPLNTEKFNNVSLESPMHWGQKYEPLSVMLYEHMYKAKVSDFGCIPHRTLEFLAASPDGIVTDERCSRYGRMLEVKNIVNREITGIPKMEYWVQMQMQMEVCELNECDFLETRFQEYADQEAFEAGEETYKGLIMLFMTGSGKPVYEYAPLSVSDAISVSDSHAISDSDAISDSHAIRETWQEAMMEKNSTLTWMKNIYWKLDQVSCVLVLRNKLWFNAVIPQLKEFWLTIETEKQNGFSHREPKKAGIRVKKIYSNAEEIPMKSQCFIDL
jgi:putative phage-type endonuclease